MSDWTSGYVADIGYTFGYYHELNPLRTRLALLGSGIACPEFGTACELGFGQGISTNIHAASTNIQWHGTDFNPSQASFAQELAGISGAGAKLYDDAFADFANRKDLPDFDYIGLHGIWSWISDDNRRVIVDFIRRKLKVGGVVYISYNTLPGWAAFAPMRHLLTEHAEVIGAEGRGIVSRINDALEFADKLLATNPVFLKANPLVADRIKQMKGLSRHYLAHEYFNRDWHPMHFATMADWLEPAKIQYACSANLIEHIDAANLTQQQQDFIQEIPDANFRESVRDFMVNQQFRRDYWVKGLRRLTPIDQATQVRQLPVTLLTPREDVSLKIQGTLGEISLTESIYNPILQLLADHKGRTIGQIEFAVKDSRISYAQVLQVVKVLSGAGHLCTIQDEATVSRMKRRTDKLNAHLLDRAKYANEANYFASPLTGGGHHLNKVQQLFLLAYTEGKKQQADWVQFAWQVLSMLGQKLVKEGKPIDAEQESLAELAEQAQVFAQKTLPIIKALHII